MDRPSASSGTASQPTEWDRRCSPATSDRHSSERTDNETTGADGRQQGVENRTGISEDVCAEEAVEISERQAKSERAHIRKIVVNEAGGEQVRTCDFVLGGRNHESVVTDQVVADQVVGHAED